jgi:hypothetical protein
VSDLATDARLLADICESLASIIDALEEVDVDQGIVVRELIAASQAVLLGARQELETKVGKAMGPDFRDVDGKRYSRHARLSKRNADNEALLRAVLDSRLVNTDTGEVIEETPVDRIKHVYPLSARDARKTALEKRGLDISEFVPAEWVGWSISEDR